MELINVYCSKCLYDISNVFNYCLSNEFQKLLFTFSVNNCCLCYIKNYLLTLIDYLIIYYIWINVIQSIILIKWLMIKYMVI